MLEVLFELLAEVLYQIVAEVLLELGCESAWHSLKAKRAANPILAPIGILALGGLAGWLTYLLLPERLSPPSRFRGSSLAVSPLLVGTFMEWFGRWRHTKRKDRTMLATFWGGAMFAFAFALVRLLTVGGGAASPE